MREALGLALAIAGKDIRAELRSRTALLSATVFAALVLVVFNFARDPTAIAAVDLAPSVLWVTFALAAMVALNRAFTIERENAALDGLLLAPVPREALFLGKLLANLAFVGTVEAVTLPLFVLFFNVDLAAALPGIIGVTALATIGFVSVGTIFSAMAVRTRFAELMLPVLLLDEPFTALDAVSAERLRDELRRRLADGLGLIVVTHHLGEVWTVATRLAVLVDGRWAADEPRVGPLEAFLPRYHGLIGA